MVKKVKKVGKKTSVDTHSAITMLVESNIVLQHKLTDVLLGVKELNSNVSSLVTIFKSAGEQIRSQKYEDPMINKINELLDENKRLAQALVMLEKMVKEKNSMPASPLGQL